MGHRFRRISDGPNPTAMLVWNAILLFSISLWGAFLFLLFLLVG